MPPEREQRRFIAGDPLRGIAASMILAFHAAALAYGATVAPGSGLDIQGAFGTVPGALINTFEAWLYVFFGLSGYLLGGPFVRHWIWGRPPVGVRHYLERRARRILPAFWLIVLVVVLVHGREGSSWKEVAAVFGLLQTFDGSALADRHFIHTWTLGLEASFYVALPLAGLVLSRTGPVRRPHRRLAIALGALAALTVASLLLRLRVDDLRGGLGRSLLALAFAFTPGLTIAAVEPALAARLRGSRAGRAAAIAFAAAGLGAMVPLMLIDANEERARVVWLVVAATGLVWAALVWQWVTGGCPRILDNRPMHALGRWSYGIYIFHVTLGISLSELIGSGTAPLAGLVLLLAMMLAASVALGAASWRWIERPILQARSPFALRPPERRGPTPSEMAP